MRLVHLADPTDPRLAPFRDLTDRAHARDQGTFVAESELVVRKLLASPLLTRALLVTPPRLESLRPLLETRELLVLVAEQPVMDAVAGFHVHRGCLALATRPPSGEVPPDARTIVVLEDLVDVDNVGAMIRNAASFGADAVLLSPRSADPFYRKAIRTSAGNVFCMPLVRLSRWPEGLAALKPRFRLLGACLDAAATPLSRLGRAERVAVLFGSEGPGLSAAAKAACDELVTIPMAPGADSLNVAVAGAVVLYELMRSPADRR